MKVNNARMCRSFRTRFLVILLLFHHEQARIQVVIANRSLPTFNEAQTPVTFIRAFPYSRQRETYFLCPTRRLLWLFQQIISEYTSLVHMSIPSYHNSVHLKFSFSAYSSFGLISKITEA